jgi:hypothetical protein
LYAVEFRGSHGYEGLGFLGDLGGKVPEVYGFVLPFAADRIHIVDFMDDVLRALAQHFPQQPPDFCDEGLSWESRMPWFSFSFCMESSSWNPTPMMVSDAFQDGVL